MPSVNHPWIRFMIAKKIARHTPPLLMGSLFAMFMINLSTSIFMSRSYGWGGASIEILSVFFLGFDLLALPLGYVAYQRLVKSRLTCQSGLTPAMALAWLLLILWLLAYFVLPRVGIEMGASSLLFLGIVFAGPVFEVMFVAMASFVLYQALLQPQGDVSAPKRARPGLIAVVATALALSGMFSLGGLEVFLGGGVFVAFGSALLISMAIFILRKMLVAGIIDLNKTPLLATLALWIFVVFCMLSPLAFVLSAIPYGGGHVPVELKMLLHIAQLFGAISLYQMCAQASHHPTAP
jgi:hypothetical protein